MRTCPMCGGNRYEDQYIWDWRRGTSKWVGAMPCAHCGGQGQVLDFEDTERPPSEDEWVPLAIDMEPTADEIVAMDEAWLIATGQWPEAA